MTATSQNGHKLRISPNARAKIEQDVAEIRELLGNVATKSDIAELREHIDGRLNEILQAVSWKKSRSARA